MARTVTEIQQTILTEKEKHPELNVLSSTSKVSKWRLFVYIISYIIFTLELLFDTHKQEVTNLISEKRPGSLRWYRGKALDFQYGFDLDPDTDKFINEDYSEEEIDTSKIIKYCAVNNSDTKGRLIVKIAGETNGELKPITEAQQESFTTYIEEIRDAGVPVTIINYLPDLLNLNITIKRDPLVLDAQGYAVVPINGIIRPVDTAIQELLRKLPFNGELIINHLEDEIQSASGVLQIKIDNASSSWIDPNTNDYGQSIGIYMSKIPESGYFKVVDFNGIKYVV
jgi:hypothetical protein